MAHSHAVGVAQGVPTACYDRTGSQMTDTTPGWVSLVMDASGSFGYPRDFATCSANWMKYFIENDYGSSVPACLENVPTGVWSGAVPVCGDGIREAGEACDCGGHPCALVDPCCDGATCQLIPSAPCSSQHDACCTAQCGYQPSGFECRAAQTVCDLTEICSGTSGACPVNAVKTLGTSCTITVPGGRGLTDGYVIPGATITGMCYGGMCQSHAEQCYDAAMRTTLGSFLTGAECTTLGDDDGAASCAPNLLSCDSSLSAGYCHAIEVNDNGGPGSGTGIYDNGGESNLIPQDGTPCGADSMCMGAACVTIASLLPGGGSPTKQPTTKAPTTKAPTTKAPSTKAPTTKQPTAAPSSAPSSAPTQAPTQGPTTAPTQPTSAPTKAPTAPGETYAPSTEPTLSPTQAPTKAPTAKPSASPTQAPTKVPTATPSNVPPTTKGPTQISTKEPTKEPTPTQQAPTKLPSKFPTSLPPAQEPSTAPTSPVQTSASTTAEDEDADQGTAVATVLIVLLSTFIGICCLGVVILGVVVVLTSRSQKKTLSVAGARIERESGLSRRDSLCGTAVELTAVAVGREGVSIKDARALGSVAGATGSALDEDGNALPAGWRRHFDESEALSYFTNPHGRRRPTWTQPQTASFEVVRDAATRDAGTDWASVRRGSVRASWTTSTSTSTAPGPGSDSCGGATWSSARDSASGLLFFTDGGSGRSSWSPPPSVEFRIDPEDGLAYTKSQFAAHYGDGGGAEWSSAVALSAVSEQIDGIAEEEEEDNSDDADGTRYEY